MANTSVMEPTTLGAIPTAEAPPGSSSMLPGTGHRTGVSASPKVWQALAWLGAKVAGIALAVTLVLTFVFTVVRVPDDAMSPALGTGDTAVVYQFARDYALGDVIALDYHRQRQLRRVVARGGDTVDITADGLEVNGAIQYEPRISEDTLAAVDGISLPVTLDEDEIFVLADVRTGGSTDSRVYGPIKVSDTIGKVITLIRRSNI